MLKYVPFQETLGKTIERVVEGEAVLCVVFTDETYTAVHASGTEEQWVITDHIDLRCLDNAEAAVQAGICTQAEVQAARSPLRGT